MEIVFVITFLGMPSRTSGEIRGRQVATALGGTACFTDVHCPDPNALAANDTVLFIRTYNAGLAKSLKASGKLVGFEVADAPVGDAVFRGKEVLDLRDFAHPECDFFVVNNDIERNDMLAVGARNVLMIPHHSTNFANTSNAFRTKPRRVGYVGLPEQLSRRADFETLCAQHNVEFISIHPNTREECDVVFRSLDVGVVFAESDHTMRPRVVELMKRYKPNTKLSNFQAYGIPSIVTPYESYRQWGNDDPGCGFEFADDANEMLIKLEDLLLNTRRRETMVRQAFERGRLFHIDRVVNEFYCDLRERIL